MWLDICCVSGFDLLQTRRSEHLLTPNDGTVRLWRCELPPLRTNTRGNRLQWIDTWTVLVLHKVFLIYNMRRKKLLFQPHCGGFLSPTPAGTLASLQRHTKREVKRSGPWGAFFSLPRWPPQLNSSAHLIPLAPVSMLRIFLQKVTAASLNPDWGTMATLSSLFWMKIQPNRVKGPVCICVGKYWYLHL